MILQGTAFVDLVRNDAVFLQESISCCFVSCPLSPCKDKYWVSGEREEKGGRPSKVSTRALQDVQDGNFSVVQQCFSF